MADFCNYFWIDKYIRCIIKEYIDALEKNNKTKIHYEHMNMILKCVPIICEELCIYSYEYECTRAYSPLICIYVYQQRRNPRNHDRGFLKV